jgi:hypothetical protein
MRRGNSASSRKGRDSASWDAHESTQPVKIHRVFEANEGRQIEALTLLLHSSPDSSARTRTLDDFTGASGNGLFDDEGLESDRKHAECKPPKRPNNGRSNHPQAEGPAPFKSR